MRTEDGVAHQLFEAYKRSCADAKVWCQFAGRTWEGLKEEEREVWRKMAQRASYVLVKGYNPGRN